MRQVPSGVVIGRGMYALLIVAAHDITIGIGFRNALSHRTAQIYHFRVRARTILQVSSLPQLIPRRRLVIEFGALQTIVQAMWRILYGIDI